MYELASACRISEALATPGSRSRNATCDIRPLPRVSGLSVATRIRSQAGQPLQLLFASRNRQVQLATGSFYRHSST